MSENQIALLFGTALGIILTLGFTEIIPWDVFFWIAVIAVIVAVFVLPIAAAKFESWRMDRK